MRIYALIDSLLNYAKQNGVIPADDEIYCRNRLLDIFELSDYTACPDEQTPETLHGILEEMLDYAEKNGLLKTDLAAERDLFDTRITGVLAPRPSALNSSFWHTWQKSPSAATDAFYKLCKNINYIRTDRIARDMAWKTVTEYGETDITINLSKPEKDPRQIAAAKLQKQSGYPKCMLCCENEGYAGRIDFPARQNLRYISVKLCGEEWAMQYSPYVYYNEHCIVFNKQHTPMRMDKSTIEKLLCFVGLFPHYFIGSNADLPIVGGSILSHEHFQGGRYDFAMAKAPVEYAFTVKGFEDVRAGTVKWPMSVIRLTSEKPSQISNLADYILSVWHTYTNAALDIYAATNGEQHNTVTAVARRCGKEYQLDIVLRNNRTTEEYPLGVFHPHPDKHHIKKENIGLIEVMGLAVLPGRLAAELSETARVLQSGGDLTANKLCAPHAEWAAGFAEKAKGKSFDEVFEIVKQETGKVFGEVLCDAGVFKRDDEGKAAFKKFADSL